MNILIFMALVLLSFSVSANEQLNSCMKEGRSYYECKQQIEKPIISGVQSSLVIRDGKNLILKSVKKVNPDKILIDGELQYTLKAHYPKHQMSLISVSGWEYFTAFIYHHKYGSYKEVFDDIRFSENGQYLVAFGADIDAEFTPNAIAVYELGNWPELMSLFQNMRFGVTDAKFISNTEVMLKIHFFKENVNGYAHGNCSLILNNGVWQFKDLECVKDADKLF